MEGRGEKLGKQTFEKKEMEKKKRKNSCIENAFFC